ncbi:MAG: sugar phosphate isomerase/epimerase [Clostridia bacterium]|nr:sugar phosphate isomerase/epimerase [Clostridia bacterium]
MRRVGLSLNHNYLNYDFFKQMASSGVTDVEISVEYDFQESLDPKKILADAKNAGVRIWSFHLPFCPFDLINPAFFDETKRENTVKFLSSIIKKWGENGIKRFVIHASGEPNADNERPLLLSQAKKSLEELSVVAKEYDAIIAVEDLPRTCLGNHHSDILYLIGDNPNLGVCFDTNHLLSERGEDFLRAVKGRLVTVHISDFDYINERHWLPGEGKIDWVSMMDALDEVGYDGTFLYELSFLSTKSIFRPTPLTPAHFYQNARELHERKPLTVNYAPYPNIDFWGNRIEK